MLMLLIDTSTERGIVAITDGTTPLFHADLPFGLQNSKSLVPTIENGLKQCRLTFHRLDAIAVGIGPGSYTGIRVGVAVAKSLSYACNLPLIGVCSLDGFIPSQNGTFAAMIDARTAGVYLLKGSRKNERIDYLTQPEVRELSLLDKRLNDVELIITPNSSRLRELLQSQFPNSIWKWQEQGPDPTQIAKRAMLKHQQTPQNGPLELLYLR